MQDYEVTSTEHRFKTHASLGVPFKSQKNCIYSSILPFACSLIKRLHVGKWQKMSITAKGANLSLH